MMPNFPKAKYRTRLPQLDGGKFLADGGIETTLIFHDGWDLPVNAAFVLLESERGRAALRAYFDRYAPMAVRQGFGFVLESPTWRANPDWAARIGRDRAQLAKINRDAIDLMIDIRDQYETKRSPFVISGCIGPRGDGYDPGNVMSAVEAEDYHGWQIGVFRETSADFVSAITMTNIPEATGVARAARAARMPCVISFTLETDGRLPTGDALGEAILAVDVATEGYPAYYMINCAHPTPFEHVLDPGAPWIGRLRGLRANSSKLSHAELDNAPELDIGNPEELGAQYGGIVDRLPQINVLGGCCGTDHRHVACIGHACKAAA
jgi:S-methylmethionine-dependent homocysteine/selenocysteine methylase